MIGRVKQSIKQRLQDRKIEEYAIWLDELYVSYHDWITKKEEIYREKKVSGAIQKDDILIFAVDFRFVDEHIWEAAASYFAENPDCILAYGDEDEWNFTHTIRMNPWFKPDFSPDTLLEYFYYGNVIVVNKAVYPGDWEELCRQWQTLEDEESREKWMYALSLRLSFPIKRGTIGHIPYVCYHTPCLKRLCVGEQYDSVREAYQRQVQDVSVSEAKVSIVIPSKDHPALLENCLESLLKTAADTEYEVIVVDNGSSEENRKKYNELKIKYGFNYIFEPMEFHFSKMCNMGAKNATGDILLFLNDDIEAAHSGWLTVMKQYACRSHAGAVGAKLYYPDSVMIQHAGITNLRLGPVHKLQFLEDLRPYYDGRNQINTNVLAVTGACLMVRKSVWEECGGFSEDLAVAFNDVELGFRFYKKGYYNTVCNTIFLYHHESISRGSDDTEEKLLRLSGERSKLYKMHPDLYGKDPFYHPYLNNLILDTRYSFAYEYPAGEDICVETPSLLETDLKKEWENECLQISLEYAGELKDFHPQADAEGEYLYFQGYQFIIGSENPCFDRFVLCCNTETGKIYKIPCMPVFRADLDRNVEKGHASLCGFCFAVKKEDMKQGRYRVGCMAKSRISRQVLCRFTNKFIIIQEQSV